jgi:hypothetical protein
VFERFDKAELTPWLRMKGGFETWTGNFGKVTGFPSRLSDTMLIRIASGMGNATDKGVIPATQGSAVCLRYMTKSHVVRIRQESALVFHPLQRVIWQR